MWDPGLTFLSVEAADPRAPPTPGRHVWRPGAGRPSSEQCCAVTLGWPGFHVLSHLSAGLLSVPSGQVQNPATPSSPITCTPPPLPGPLGLAALCCRPCSGSRSAEVLLSLLPRCPPFLGLARPARAAGLALSLSPGVHLG